MNKKGFVATSILYSFLAIFTLLIMTIVANYAHNRVLLNKTSQSIKNSIEENYDTSGAIMPVIENYAENNDLYIYPVVYDNCYKFVYYDDWKKYYDYSDGIFAQAIISSKEITDINYNECSSNLGTDPRRYYWIPRFAYKETDNEIYITFNTTNLNKYKYNVFSAFKIFETDLSEQSTETNKYIDGFWIQKGGRYESDWNSEYYSFGDNLNANQFMAFSYLYKYYKNRGVQESNYKVLSSISGEKCYIREYLHQYNGITEMDDDTLFDINGETELYNYNENQTFKTNLLMTFKNNNISISDETCEKNYNYNYIIKFKANEEQETEPEENE